MKSALAEVAACCAIHLGLVGLDLGWAAWTGTTATVMAVTTVAVVVAVHRRGMGCAAADAGSTG